MSERDSGISRRVFLKVAGAATGAGVACSSSSLPEKLIPYLVSPEDVVPGRPIFYRTFCRGCAAGCGVTARTREGRVIKLEGNPEDPIGRGALCARGQAAVQILYAPDRFLEPHARAGTALAKASWDAVIGQLVNAVNEARRRRPGTIRLLTRAEPGAAGLIQRAFLERLGAPAEARLVFEPSDPEPIRAASEMLYGRRELPVLDLNPARTVVGFGADFLATGSSPVEHARQLASGRGRVGEERTRLIWIAPRLALTGASADQWITVRPGGELAFAAGLLRWLCDPASGVSTSAPETPAIFDRVRHLGPKEVEAASGVPWSKVVSLGREVAQRRPSALVGPGLISQGADATELALVLALANHVLGNDGQTVLHGLDPLLDPPASSAEIRHLLDDLNSGRVSVLLLHHADPIGTLPAALGVADALKRVPLVVSFSDLPDPSTLHAHLVLPDHHPLETFADVSLRKGIVAVGQPAMEPVGNTRASSQVLLDVASKLTTPPPAGVAPLPTDFVDFMQARFEELAKIDGSSGARPVQERGGVYTQATPDRPALRIDRLPPFGAGLKPLHAAELALVPFATPLRDGGPRAPWLDEVPDVISGIAWSAWAELSPATAARLGVADGEIVEIRSAAAAVRLPVCIYPGLSDAAIALPLGQELRQLAPSPEREQLFAWAGTPLEVRRTGQRIELARADAGPTLSSGGLLPLVTPSRPTLARESASPSLSPEPAHPKHRWAMAIDLDRCTGCQACVVACYAENNVPVLGAEAIARGRSMAWIQIQRYVEQEESAPRVDLLPMLCQQCTNAPCETVCPVYATYHTGEGLNAQVYNRCVGTRYCSNNCPYKVRVFNWFDPQFPKPLDWQLNPDVSVRSKGVMEKCTFCVQRIRFAEQEARQQGRPIRDGELQPACVQTCPAQAMAFGDALDRSSRVAALREDGRAFHVLGDLNTKPAITYLARIRDKAP